MNPLRDRLKALQAKPAGAWYWIRNESDKAVVRIYDEISWWGVTADDLASEIAKITASEIEVQINSPGGDVFDGLAIYNALRMHPARVTTRIDGLAASAASFIVQAGDHRVIVQSAQMMIHEARGAVWGTADEIRQFADLVAQQNDVMAQLYAQRAGGDVEHFRELMTATTWFTDQQALDEGLVDELYVPPRQEASTKTRPAATAAAGDDHQDEDDHDVEGFDPSALLARSKVRELFGSPALAD
jgi:ATP-dependent Clp endopeptidase proteolytic subunit ClpP